MFGLIKKIFNVLLSIILNRSNHTKCVSLTNQKYMIQPTLINLHPNEYSQEFHHAVDVLEVFNMITGINENINKADIMGM